MPYGVVLRLLIARGLFIRDVRWPRPTVRGGIVVSWCGMRGIVTLAAAFALPESFPYRDLMLLTAFAVVLGSLVIQGLTLRPLIAALRLEGREPGDVGSRRAPAPWPIAPRWMRSTATRPRRPRYSGWNTARCCCAPKEPDGGVASGELPADPLRRRAITPRGNRSSSCGNPRRSATMRFTSSRKSSTGRN